MSDILTVIARLTANPGQSDSLGEQLRQVVAPTRREPGSLAYTLHRDIANPDVWILYERWASRAALDTHFQQPYIQALLARAPDLLAKEPEMTLATAIGE